MDAFINLSLQNNSNKSRKKVKNIPKNSSPLSSIPPWKSKEVSSPQTLSFQDIQKEEEKVKQESFIKTLQGNTIPWLVDRNVAKSSSMEQIMKSQIEEQIREREEKELMEALAAIERMEKLENENNKNNGNNNKPKKGNNNNYRRKRGETR